MLWVETAKSLRQLDYGGLSGESSAVRPTHREDSVWPWRADPLSRAIFPDAETYARPRSGKQY